MEQGLSGKRVLVTGGTRGSGRATVLAFARAGARVVTCHHRPSEDADNLAAELKGIPGDHLVVTANVTASGDVAHLVNTCATHLGGLDVLVNNVGVDGHMPFAVLDDNEWYRVFDHNVTSAYRVTQLALPVLADGASVINVGASSALRGRPQAVHHTASKAALLGFTAALSKELGPRRIRVNTVAPGYTSDNPEAELPPPVLRQLLAATPLGRLTTPEDVAGAVLFLAGDTSRQISGAVLHVDGGM